MKPRFTPFLLPAGKVFSAVSEASLAGTWLALSGCRLADICTGCRGEVYYGCLLLIEARYDSSLRLNRTLRPLWGLATVRCA